MVFFNFSTSFSELLLASGSKVEGSSTFSSEDNTKIHNENIKYKMELMLLTNHNQTSGPSVRLLSNLEKNCQNWV